MGTSRPGVVDDLFIARWVERLRLVLGVLETIHPHAVRLAPLLPPDLANALADGTLLRYAAPLSAADDRVET